jgi:hypothetical protein
VVVVLVGLAVRVPAVADPYSSFHPSRQYRDAVVARDLTYRLWGAPSAEVEEAAGFALVDFGPKEPPGLESVAAVLRVAEPGDWWRARLVVVFGFLAGVVFLAGRMRRVLGTPAAIGALGVGVLLPYLVHATSSFQPDPIVAGLLCACFGLLLGLDEGDLRRRTHLAVGVLGGVAAVMKPTALPVILLPYLFLHRRQLRSGHVVAAVALLSVPAVAWTLANLVFADTLDSHAANSIVPSLLRERTFWSGWSNRVDDVYTLPVVLLALLGAFLGPRLVRDLTLAGGLGYVLVGLTFTHHMATHDYYHLILVPVVMLGIGGLVAGLPSRVPSVRPALLAGAGVVLLGAFAVGSVRAVDTHLDSGADRTAEVAAPFVAGTDGESVSFSRDDGMALEYLTKSSIYVWPTAADLAFRARSGEELDAGEALLQQHRDLGVRWFVLTVPEDAARVPELVELLAPFEVAACTPDGIVVDLDAATGDHAVRACLDDLGLDTADR